MYSSIDTNADQPATNEAKYRPAASLITVTALPAHLVFAAKDRHPVFAGRHPARLQEIMRDVCADFETELAEFNGAEPRPPPRELPAYGRPLKAGQLADGRLLPAQCGRRSSTCAAAIGANGPWSGSYFAGSGGGAPVSVLRECTEQNQSG